MEVAGPTGALVGLFIMGSILSSDDIVFAPGILTQYGRSDRDMRRRRLERVNPALSRPQCYRRIRASIRR
jgi:hypothetical protein